MKINHIETEQAHIVELEGRLDTVNNGQAESFFDQLTEVPKLSILVDCENLSFINSSGLRVLIMSLKKLKTGNRKLVLCNLQKNIKDVFRFSGFNNLFDIELNKEEAMKLIGN